MKDIRLDQTRKWQGQHLKSIVSAYGRSPWFDHYRESLTGLYNRPFSFLLDWNLCCFEWTMKQLGNSIEVSLTDSYIPAYDPGSHIDRRNQLTPKNYLSRESVMYTQVFQEKHGFRPNLSILDLLFCEGKNARKILWPEP